MIAVMDFKLPGGYQFNSVHQEDEMSFLNKNKLFFALVAPAVGIYLCYIIYPVIRAFNYSLTNYAGLGAFKYVGFQNYIRLFQDNIFWISVKNVSIILIFAFVISVPVAFMLALIINMKMRSSEVLKLIFFAPGVLAPIITGLIWVFIFDPYIGILNSVFRALGLSALQPQWIGGLSLTPFSASIVYVWSNAGFFMMILLAGMKMISNDYYEASTVDGATKLQQMFKITIPMLFESFKSITVLIITGSFKVFETIYILTNGGPNHYSESILTYMYNVTFIQSRYGYGMSIAILEFILAIGLSLIVLKFTSKEIT